MSEFIKCDSCGELSIFDNITYINNTTLCSSCNEENGYLLQPNNTEYVKKS